MKYLQALRIHYKLISLFVVFAVVFVWLSLTSPTDRPVLQTTNLTHTQINILILAVVLPYVGIWMVGLVGYMRLYSYAHLVRNTQEGRPLRQLGSGILGVLLSLPLMSINNALAQVLQAHHYDHVMLVRRIGVFVVLAVLLASFYALMRCTNAMLAHIGQPYRPIPRSIALLVMLMGGLYIYFVLTNPLFENGPVAGHFAPWLAIDAVVLPRLLAWYWGVNAVWNLYQYARVVPGKLYRLAFNYLAVGVGVVTITIVLLQYLQAVSAVTKLPIAMILLLIYIILVLASAGFMLVARGGTELAKIEEV